MLTPILTLAISTLIVLMYGAFTNSARGSAYLTVLALLSSAAPLYLAPFTGALFPTTTGVLMQISPFTNIASLLVLLIAVVTVPLLANFFPGKTHKPELYVLLLLTTLGMLILTTAADLLTFYVALELMSFPLYILAAFNRDDAKSSESGLKYFVLGGFASGLTLYGISLIYAALGTTAFHAIAHTLAPMETFAPVLLVGLALTILGSLFKLSVAPFHMWTPDVYEGAPTPITAIMSSLPKIAAFVFLMRLTSGPFAAMAHTWQPALALLAGVSMFTGATLAIIQSNLKRLLAFSTIANVGFIMVGVVAGTSAGHAGALFYVAVYALTTIGLFAAVMASGAEKVEDWKGLATRNPTLATILLLMLFSLAGVPPLAGFMAKFTVFAAAVEAGYTNLAIVGVIASVIACFYSLWLIKVMYFDAPVSTRSATGAASKSPPPTIPTGLQLVLGLTAAITVVLGLFPTLLSAPIATAATTLF